MIENKTECPQCLGIKKYLKSKGKRRKMTNCDLCDENGQIEETIADDFINTKIHIHGEDYDRLSD